MPKIPKQTIASVPYTPTRADPSIVTAGANQDAPSGFSVVTNNRAGALQPRAMTGKTLTTGGV